MVKRVIRTMETPTQMKNQIRKPTVESENAPESQEAQDRREHLRHLTVMRVAKLENEELEIEGLGVVRNVSEGGMMIDAHISVEIGQRITVSLLEDHNVAGEVLWKDGDSIGIAFDSPVKTEYVLARPAALKDGRKPRLPRLTVNRIAQIQLGPKKIEARVCDVSQRGAKIECKDRLLPNEQILIVLGEQKVRGTIKWHTGNFSGVEFHRLLPVDELLQWLPKNPEIG